MRLSINPFCSFVTQKYSNTYSIELLPETYKKESISSLSSLSKFNL